MQRCLVIVALLATAVLFTSCANLRPESFLSHFTLDEPSVEDFEVCASAGCRSVSRLGYSPSEWESIEAIFSPPPVNAAEERERVRIAIAAMETIIGAQNGTSADHARNQRKGATGPQLDCIAEAANTTVGLLLLQKESLLRFHTASYPAHRGFFQLRLPHNSATLSENSSGERYAMDSWFFANGEKPACVPVKTWKAGYSPQEPD
ncbi:hypothetical protein [Coraliomargarita parva]|uniref:hypothetical protein n=1 Tax=Coraliomargarita parva TaxID=3014050 RepID=UPI0022B4C1B0|nr:hypothetical protein [Coraliomargarita parva]